MKFKLVIQAVSFSLLLIFASTGHAATSKSHSTILPIAENAVAIQKDYLPNLSISNGCYPYTAVDVDGNWSGGLKDSGSASGACSSTNYQQVYVRTKNIGNGIYANMYAYYFPKDNGWPFASIGHRHDWEHVIVFVKDYNTSNEKIVGAAYSAHGGVSTTTSPNKNGNHIYIKYGYNGSFTHSFVEGNSGTQDKHVLIRYNKLSEAAKNTLNTVSFGNAIVPFKESKFNSNIDKAREALNL